MPLTTSMCYYKVSFITNGFDSGLKSGLKIYICTTAAFNNPGITVGQGCLLTYTSEILTDFWFSVGPVGVQIVANTGECAFNDIHPNISNASPALSRIPVRSDEVLAQTHIYLPTYIQIFCLNIIITKKNEINLVSGKPL